MRSGIARASLNSCIVLLAGLSLLSPRGGSIPYALAGADDDPRYLVQPPPVQESQPPVKNSPIRMPAPKSSVTGIQRITYAVEGWALGTHTLISSDEYRQFQCAPSDQFAGYTWCTKKRTASEPRGKFDASYSVLHDRDGTLAYINRFQSPAYWSGTEVDDDIKRYSNKIGTQPRILQMPSRPGLPKGTLATWGKVILEPLDRASVTALAEGRSVKRGLLVDYIGDITRSAREGLPIYQISGSAGFGWIASYDESGRGTLRFFAVNASAFSELRQKRPESSQLPNEIAPSVPGQANRPTVQKREDSAHLAYANATPQDLKKHQLTRDGLFKNLQANTKKYTFKYIVIDLPAGTLPGINHPIPVSFIRYEGAAFFGFDRFSLEPAAEVIISDFAKTMLRDRSYRSVVIVGHTDSVGTNQYNYDLSKNRAATVATALRTAGLPDNYLGLVPMGKAQPINANNTPEGQALNRRVEFFISDIPGAPEKVIERIPYNPCHLRDDCTVETESIPVLSPDGNQKGITLDLRYPLPKNSPDGFGRPPLPDLTLIRRPLKELQLEQ